MLRDGTGRPSPGTAAYDYQLLSTSGVSVRSSNRAREYSTLSASYVPLPSLQEVLPVARHDAPASPIALNGPPCLEQIAAVLYSIAVC